MENIHSKDVVGQAAHTVAYTCKETGVIYDKSKGSELISVLVGVFQRKEVESAIRPSSVFQLQIVTFMFGKLSTYCGSVAL